MMLKPTGERRLEYSTLLEHSLICTEQASSALLISQHFQFVPEK
jgi:hypothetical protein